MSKKDNYRKERTLECPNNNESCYGNINESSQSTESHFDSLSMNNKNKVCGQQKFTYSTLEFIEDLREELKKYPEELTLIFPNRVKKYSYKDLSIFWANYEYFIKNLKRRKANYKIGFEMLDILQKKLINRFGEKSIKCLKIIRRSCDNEFSINQFFDLLTSEMGRISGEIEVTDEEMGNIFQGTKTYIHDKIYLTRNKYPNFKFSLERLNYMKNNIKLILGVKSKAILNLMLKYRELNPDLKIYPKQQYTIKNHSFFEEIDSYEKSYWFGFLHADGWLNRKTYRIGLELSVKDKEQVLTFAKIMGLDKNRIKERTRFYKYKGKIKSSLMVYLKFICKPMAQDLCNHGFLNLKENSIGIPKFVKSAIKDAISRFSLSDSTNLKSFFEYKLALAWLLGFFDGDGTSPS